MCFCGENSRMHDPRSTNAFGNPNNYCKKHFKLWSYGERQKQKTFSSNCLEKLHYQTIFSFKDYDDIFLDIFLNLKQKAFTYFNSIKRNIKTPITFSLKELLIAKDFSETFSNEIVLTYSSIGSFNDAIIFLEKIKDVISHKNSTLDYFISKGHSKEESISKLKQFYNLGSLSSKTKSNKSTEYKSWFNSTRIPGAIASSVANRDHNKSKTELKIIESLTKRGKQVDTNYYSPVVNSYLSQVKNKRNYCHDIYLKDSNVIIEYNGSYWHNDFFANPVHRESDYQDEIIKAHNCIYEVNRKNLPKYIIIWEYDFNNDVNKIHLQH